VNDSLSTATEAAERQRVLRALLVRPLLTASGPYAAEVAMARRHAGWLRDWLSRYPGWSLQIDGEIARLRKTPGDLSDGTRPAREPVQDVPFSRRRYVLFCLALAALERSDRQTALGRLANDIVDLVLADPALAAAGIAFDLTSHDQRRDLVQVTRLLLDLEVLIRVHGNEQQYLDERGDVLYNVNRPALSAMLNVRRAPSSIEATDVDRRLALLVDEPVSDTIEGRNRRLRARLIRALLDDPVVYYETLDADAQAYLTQQRVHMARQIAEATGLIPELRREGVAMTDDRGDVTDIGLPEEGTEGHLTLLIAEFLAGHARRAPGVAVSMAALYQRTVRLVDEHRGHWRKSVTQPGAETAATDATIDRLVSLRLAVRVPEGVVPLPAIARYAVAAVVEARARTVPRRSSDR
jgi:uncharacterized protein (TIGR02678 family)